MENEKQVKNEQALVKKVGDIANVLAAAGVGFTDYITQQYYFTICEIDKRNFIFVQPKSVPTLRIKSIIFRLLRNYFVQILIHA